MNHYKLTQPSEIASLLEGLLLEATSVISNTLTTSSKADIYAAPEKYTQVWGSYIYRDVMPIIS